MEDLQEFIDYLKTVPTSDLKKVFDREYVSRKKMFENGQYKSSGAASDLECLGDFFDCKWRRPYLKDSLWDILEDFGLYLIEKGFWDIEVKENWNK